MSQVKLSLKHFPFTFFSGHHRDRLRPAERHDRQAENVARLLSQGVGLQEGRPSHHGPRSPTRARHRTQ